ncbi:hypothetical protein [Desulfobacula sp.]|uniref:hypothetical protein n=1 Tax=Desulfobacula sp. TaxID=2593537 RepID=UPI0025C0A770|nr:hypothetical protein [Desulfobacula sp.]
MIELKQKIALFIDADNAPANRFEDVLSEVAKYGVVTWELEKPLSKAMGRAFTRICDSAGTTI